MGKTMIDACKNIFAHLPDSLPEELFQELAYGKGFKLERIISMGHATPVGQWYDQEQHEWVLLLSGSAGLRFEGEETVQELRPGDFVDILAHKRHRVEWTDPKVKTVWLALHYST
jgi:cupin 2 domain-containing protein